MQVDGVLVLSGAHIKPRTEEYLRTDPASPWTIRYDYGFIVCVNTEARTVPGYPDLTKVLEFAWQNRCRWVRLDCDADILPELPDYSKEYK